MKRHKLKGFNMNKDFLIDGLSDDEFESWLAKPYPPKEGAPCPAPPPCIDNLIMVDFVNKKRI
jgi:hypothetical protein